MNSYGTRVVVSGLGNSEGLARDIDVSASNVYPRAEKFFGIYQWEEKGFLYVSADAKKETPSEVLHGGILIDVAPSEVMVPVRGR